MIKIEFITAPICHECAKAKQIIEEVEPQYPEIQVEEIDVMTPKGIELAQKYCVMASPAIIINDELFSTGALAKEAFVRKLNELKRGGAEEGFALAFRHP